VLVLVMIAVGSSLHHNGEMDALARSAGVQNAVCSKALSGISRPLALVFEPSSPVLHIRVVRTQHHPSTSTASLAKPR